MAASNIIVVPAAGALGGVTPRKGVARGGRRGSPAKCDGERLAYAKLDGNVVVSGALLPPAIGMGSPNGIPTALKAAGLPMPIDAPDPYCACIISGEVEWNWNDDDEVAAANSDIDCCILSPPVDRPRADLVRSFVRS